MEEKINKNYKDSVFVDLFYEDEKAKENELSLYNALFGTNYTLDDVEIEKIRVEGTIYMNLRNDVSFNVGNRVLVFSEYQSTINGNMPLRDLMYVARTYEKMVPVKSRYKAKTVKIPKPEFFVFYNGTEKVESEYELKLSDAYIERAQVDNKDEDDLSLELKVKVININSNSGNDVLEKCKVLREYTQLVEKVRELKTQGETGYMKKAIKYCIEHHILEEYLRRKGSDVVGFLCAEYDYEMDMQVKGEEKYEEGYAAGEIAGKTQGITQGIVQGKAEAVIELLETLGNVSEELKSVIMQQKDMNVLNMWLKISAKVSNIDEFRKETKI